MVTAKAETNETVEILPENVSDAMLTCVSYMPSSALAELVDYWSDEPRTLPLAQTALDEGTSNCGLMELAEYVASRDRRSTAVLAEWHAAGLKMEPIVFYPRHKTNEEHEEIDRAVKAVERLIFH